MHRKIIDTYIYNYKEKKKCKNTQDRQPTKDGLKQAAEQLEESRQVVNALTETASGQEKESGSETNSQATESGTSAPASEHAGPRDDQQRQALRGQERERTRRFQERALAQPGSTRPHPGRGRV